MFATAQLLPHLYTINHLLASSHFSLCLAYAFSRTDSSSSSLPLTAAMAEWAGPKGRASTKPRRPSGLQNEVYQDATDDEYAGGERHIRVPDSDCVTPETQFRHVEDDADDFGNDLPHDADGSELCIMSPNSLALLNRNQVVKRGEPSGTAINLGSLLSRPAQNTPSSLPTPHFFYPPRKALPTRALKPDVAAAANLAESNVASTAPEPEEATRRRKCHLCPVVHPRPC
jgi:hypothetical protein